MNLEINIKVPLGAAEVSVAQSIAPPPRMAEVAPPVPVDAFPPPYNLESRLPWGVPQPAPNESYVVPPDAGPPSLAELGVAFDPRPDLAPPPLPELEAGLAAVYGNGGTPPGLEGVELPDVGALAGSASPPPGLEEEIHGAHAPHARPGRPASGRQRKE